MASTPLIGPKPSDANKKNERDASEADRRTLMNFGRRKPDAEPSVDGDLHKDD